MVGMVGVDSKLQIKELNHDEGTAATGSKTGTLCQDTAQHVDMKF
jgi:hypothetical protein